MNGIFDQKIHRFVFKQYMETRQHKLEVNVSSIQRVKTVCWLFYTKILKLIVKLNY